MAGLHGQYLGRDWGSRLDDLTGGVRLDAVKIDSFPSPAILRRRLLRRRVDQFIDQDLALAGVRVIYVRHDRKLSSTAESLSPGAIETVWIGWRFGRRSQRKNLTT